MKLYKYVTPDRVDVVRDLRIRFTPPGFLNDPFECRIAFIPSPDKRNGDHLPADSSFDQDEYVRMWRRMASIEWGILCLTKRPDNLVMWAHYAAAHRGFLLEFDSDNPFFQRPYVMHLDWTWMEDMPLKCPGFGNLMEVQYCQQRPFTSNRNEIPVSSFFVKSTDWAYEEEVRMILPLAERDYESPARDVHLFRFPPEALTGMILGAGADSTLTDQLATLIHNENLRHVVLRQAKLSLCTFEMEFKQI